MFKWISCEAFGTEANRSPVVHFASGIEATRTWHARIKFGSYLASNVRISLITWKTLAACRVIFSVTFCVIAATVGHTGIQTTSIQTVA